MSDLKVIGCGLPRTGTASLQRALEILGFSPCYHMFEVFKDAQRAKDWLAAFQARRRGEKVDYEHLLEGFQAAVDAPASEVYLDLIQQNPKLRVILTHRPSADWLQSCRETILRVTNPIFGLLVYWVPEAYWQRRMCVEELFPLYEERYGGFREETMRLRREEAEREVPADRLLIFRVQEGWEPLCAFLDVPIPSVPFPRVNDANSVKRFILRKVAIGLMRWTMLLGGVVAAVKLVQRVRLVA